MTAYYTDPDQIIGECVGLSFETRGAYAILVMLMEGGRKAIPDDARWIAGIIGCSTRLWNTIRTGLIASGKIRSENGALARVSGSGHANTQDGRGRSQGFKSRRSSSRPKSAESADDPQMIGGKSADNLQIKSAKPADNLHEKRPTSKQNNGLRDQPRARITNTSRRGEQQQPLQGCCSPLPPADELPSLPEFLDRRRDGGWGPFRQALIRALDTGKQRGDAVFDTWIAPTVLRSANPALIEAPSGMHAAWLRNHHSDAIKRVLGIDAIDIRVGGQS